MREKQFGILGLGHFGEALAIELSNLGADVIVVDKNEDKIQNIANDVTYAVQADVADINVLRSIGIKNVDAVVISITSDINSNLMAVLNCQELGVPEIYSKANNIQHEKVLKHLGVDLVFNPENDMGIQTAHRLYSGGFLHQLSLSSEYSIIEINALKNWYNKTLASLDLRRRYGINVIAIVHEDTPNIVPGGNDLIQKGDKLIVLGDNLAINDLKRIEASEGLAT